MNEVKKPRRPLIFYYCIVLGVILLLNLFVLPAFQQMRIKEVSYDTFIRMTENKEIAEVQVESNRILFTDQNKNIYKTGIMDDPELTERLYNSGAKFSGEIIE